MHHVRYCVQVGSRAGASTHALRGAPEEEQGKASTGGGSMNGDRDMLRTAFKSLADEILQAARQGHVLPDANVEGSIDRLLDELEVVELVHCKACGVRRERAS